MDAREIIERTYEGIIPVKPEIIKKLARIWICAYFRRDSEE